MVSLKFLLVFLAQPRSSNLCELITDVFYVIIINVIVIVIIINVIVNVIIIIPLMYMETVNEFNFTCNTF